MGVKKSINGILYEMTAEEEAEVKAEADFLDRNYWLGTSYDDLVDIEIRKQYSISQEFAILRQRDEKQDEYAAYYQYCEECKEYVREQMNKYK